VFSVYYSEAAKRQLTKLDKQVARMLYAWIGKNLEGSENPRTIGKPLIGDQKGSWRYRVGNYRIIADIEDEKLIILVIAVGHRREIYS
jgi:mRNA interferase RelE/StbE